MPKAGHRLCSRKGNEVTQQSLVTEGAGERGVSLLWTDGGVMQRPSGRTALSQHEARLQGCDG
jgi:hypothetical protein